MSASELFGGLSDLAATGGAGFANATGETLFEALSRTAVDWEGVTSCDGSGSTCDLSAHIATDLGRFADRDTLFRTHGQTLCWAARTVCEPVLGRWSAGVGTRATA